jgi:hypothetical protein
VLHQRLVDLDQLAGDATAAERQCHQKPPLEIAPPLAPHNHKPMRSRDPLMIHLSTTHLHRRLGLPLQRGNQTAPEHVKGGAIRAAHTGHDIRGLQEHGPPLPLARHPLRQILTPAGGKVHLHPPPTPLALPRPQPCMPWCCPMKEGASLESGGLWRDSLRRGKEGFTQPTRYWGTYPLQITRLSLHGPHRALHTWWSNLTEPDHEEAIRMLVDVLVMPRPPPHARHVIHVEVSLR